MYHEQHGGLHVWTYSNMFAKATHVRNSEKKKRKQVFYLNAVLIVLRCVSLSPCISSYSVAACHASSGDLNFQFFRNMEVENEPCSESSGPYLYISRHCARKHEVS